MNQFQQELDDTVAGFLRDEMPGDLARPAAPRIAAIGTVAAHALQSPLLTRQLQQYGMSTRTTVGWPGVDELADDESWDLAMVLSPHKLDVARRCTALAPAAAQTGVVDTVRRTTGGTIGCNTNVAASAAALGVLLGRQLPQRILVGGAGASSLSVIAGIQQRFPRSAVGLWGRSPQKVSSVISRLSGVTPVECPAEWGADVVVNATTVGETGAELPASFPLLDALSAGVRFFDLNNTPNQVQSSAVAAGCVTMSGVLMQTVTNALRIALLGGFPAIRRVGAQGR